MMYKKTYIGIVA